MTKYWAQFKKLLVENRYLEVILIISALLMVGRAALFLIVPWLIRRSTGSLLKVFVTRRFWKYFFADAVFGIAMYVAMLFGYYKASEDPKYASYFNERS